MPKKSRKGFVKSLGDVTLNDYANSSAPKNRIKKASDNVNVVLKQEAEKSWDEKDEEDFEGEFVSQENEDGTFTVVLKKLPTTPKRSLSTSKGQGKDYSIDIWFLISEYIKPEDVGTFAAICRTSFEVVCTAKFWFNLHRRCYKNVPDLPELLQPESLIRKYGLRKNVIRALYHMYTPFVNRLRLLKFEEHPETLKNYGCQSVWYVEDKEYKYYYFFKMKKNISNCLSHSSGQLPDLLEALDDIAANPDEHCKVLRVTCLHHHHIQPQIIGLSLKSASVNLSRGMWTTKCQHQKLQLVFGTKSYMGTSQSGADCTLVLLDPVINIRVFDWWHPLYPYNRNELGRFSTCEE
ncbi:unnamed protein product [Ceutorhynchus assimilis]|uniref:Transmembrane protein 183 n=1 Tax=Ceutorhynchus assimilis TaxID=467358 RepID=A0A9N9MS21_9CUCU|nr:unnamed protein product [Ceutorhynchus assimilis]